MLRAHGCASSRAKVNDAALPLAGPIGRVRSPYAENYPGQ